MRGSAAPGYRQDRVAQNPPVADTYGGAEHDDSGASRDNELNIIQVRALQQGGEAGPAKSTMLAQPTKRGAASLQPDHATIECCLKVAEDIDTVMANRLREQQSQNPTVFAQQLQNNGQRLMELCALRQADPGLYSIKLQEMKVESQVLRVGRELCKALQHNDAQVCANLEGELRSALQTQLVYEIKSRGDFLLALRERTQDLTDDLDHMAKQFPQTVEQRLREMKACRDPNNPRWQQPEVWKEGIEAEPVIPAE